MAYSSRELFERSFAQELSTRQNYSDTKLKIQQNDPRRMGLYWLRRRVFDREQLRQRDEPLAFVSDREIFGDLVDEPAFVAAYSQALESLHAVGARATLQALVSAVPA